MDYLIMYKIINTMQINKVLQIITEAKNIQLHRPWLSVLFLTSYSFLPQRYSQFWILTCYISVSQLFCYWYFNSKTNVSVIFLNFVIGIILHIFFCYCPFHSCMLYFWDSAILLHGSVIIPLIWVIVFHCMNMLSSCHLPIIDICIFEVFVITILLMNAFVYVSWCICASTR